MKIATWNVERLKHKAQLDEIVCLCEQSGADILVITETDTQIAPTYAHSIATPHLPELQGVRFKPTERTVAIHTRYPIKSVVPTFNAFTAACVEQQTELGSLLLFGVVIGRLGNRQSDFLPDLKALCCDIDNAIAHGHSICVCGDFNLTFADNYYFTTEGRALLLDCFNRNHIRLATAERPECIDHIAISESLIANASMTVNEWNLDKRLSDHKGIAVSFETK